MDYESNREDMMKQCTWSIFRDAVKEADKYLSTNNAEVSTKSTFLCFYCICSVGFPYFFTCTKEGDINESTTMDSELEKTQTKSSDPLNRRTHPLNASLVPTSRSSSLPKSEEQRQELSRDELIDSLQKVQNKYNKAVLELQKVKEKKKSSESTNNEGRLLSLTQRLKEAENKVTLLENEKEHYKSKCKGLAEKIQTLETEKNASLERLQSASEMSLKNTACDTHCRLIEVELIRTENLIQALEKEKIEVIHEFKKLRNLLETKEHENSVLIQQLKNNQQQNEKQQNLKSSVKLGIQQILEKQKLLNERKQVAVTSRRKKAREIWKLDYLKDVIEYYQKENTSLLEKLANQQVSLDNLTRALATKRLQHSKVIESLALEITNTDDNIRKLEKEKTDMSVKLLQHYKLIESYKKKNEVIVEGIHVLENKEKALDDACALEKDHIEKVSKLEQEHSNKKETEFKLERENKAIFSQLEEVNHLTDRNSLLQKDLQTVAAKEKIPADATEQNLDNSVSNLQPGEKSLMELGKRLAGTSISTGSLDLDTHNLATKCERAIDVPKTSAKRARLKKSKSKEKEEHFEVEHILTHKYNASGKWYFVRWKGFKPEDDSWVIENNMDCPKILQEYIDKNLNSDN